MSILTEKERLRILTTIANAPSFTDEMRSQMIAQCDARIAHGDATPDETLQWARLAAAFDRRVIS